ELARPWVKSTKARRSHSNHHEIRAVQGDALPRNRRIRSEPASPQVVAEHHYGARSRRAAIRLHKRPPQRRALSQDIEEVAGRFGSRQLPRALPAQCRFLQKWGIRQQAAEHVIVRPIVLIFRVGKQSGLAVQDAPGMAMEDLVDAYELVRSG